MKLLLTMLAAGLIGGLAWIAVASYNPQPSRSKTIPADPDPAQLRTQSEEASPAQQAALADGVITWEEYASAVQANTECIRAKGILVSDPQVLPGNLLNGTAGPFASEDEMNRASGEMQKCSAEHLNAVATRWTIQNAPSPEKLAKARAALRACIEASGIAVGVNDGREDFVGAAINHPEEFTSCAGRVSEEFQIAHFGG